MDTPWQRYLQVGIVHPMLYPEIASGQGPIIETAWRVATDPFFEVLEVGLVPRGEVRDDLRRLLDEAQVTIIVGAHTAILRNKLNLAALNESERQRSVECVETVIGQAYELGAKMVSLLDGADAHPGSMREDKAKSQLTRSLRELCAYAQAEAGDYAMTLALEPFDRDVEKRSLLGPSPDVAEIVTQVIEDYDNFGVTVDLSHLPLLRETPGQCLALLGDYVVHAHVGNCIMKDRSHPAYGDQHPPIGCLGGENDVDDLTGFLRLLLEVGYLGKALPTGRAVVSFEVKPLPGTDPELVIASSKRVWQAAWAQL